MYTSAYSVGDSIVHPLHGAGVIREVTKQEIDGNVELYYVLELALDSVKIYLPVKTCEKNGIRPICSREQAQEIITMLPKLPVEEETVWNKRYRENMLHIRSGDPLQVAQAAKNLWQREQAHGLSGTIFERIILKIAALSGNPVTKPFLYQENIYVVEKKQTETTVCVGSAARCGIFDPYGSRNQ